MPAATSMNHAAAAAHAYRAEKIDAETSDMAKGTTTGTKSHSSKRDTSPTFLKPIVLLRLEMEVMSLKKVVASRPL